MSTIMLRSTNFDGNNKLTYTFPTPVDLRGCEIALYSYSFYNSFYNVSTSLGGNTLSLKIPSFSGNNTYTFSTFTGTVPDGFYTYKNLNYWIQQFCIAQKIALYKSSDGSYWYPFQIVENTTSYSVNLLAYYYPTASQASTLGYSLISGSTIVLNPETTSPLQVSGYVTNMSSGVGNVTGYIAGQDYPPSLLTVTNTTYQSTASYTGSSNKTPMINQIDSICLRSNACQNDQSSPTDLLAVIPISSAYGALTQYIVSSPIYMDCPQKYITSIEVTINDQNLSSLYQRDPEMTMVLHIKKK